MAALHMLPLNMNQIGVTIFVCVDMREMLHTFMSEVTCCRYRSTFPPVAGLLEATANIGRLECQVN